MLHPQPQMAQQPDDVFWRIDCHLLRAHHAHHRVIKQGDRLDLMTYGIYNDPKYFLQVAKANGLTSIRRLQPGNDIYFPPFNKNEN